MSRRQHLDALRIANARRSRAAELRAELRSLDRETAARRVAAILRDPDDAAGSMPIDRLLGCVRQLGAKRVARLMAHADVRRSVQVRDVTPGRREALARLLDDLAARASGTREAA